MTVTSREIHLIARPDGLPKVEQFELVETEVADPAEGDILVENLYMSVDPAMRPRLAGQPLNVALDGGAIGRVVESANSGFSAGQYVSSGKGFREFFVSNGADLRVVDPGDIPLTAYMGPLGGTGFTAYGGLLVTGELKEGENVFVSAAAGAVGSCVVQIAKIKNCFVIGSAGSDEKCSWLTDELGCDVAINYKTGVLRKELKGAARNGIDVYFENVGGEHLNAALPRMNVGGRIPVCGMISAYNNFGAISEPVTMLANMIYQRITMKGFVVTDFEDIRDQFTVDMKRWISDGSVQYRETIMDGIASTPEALIGLFTGLNTGKMLVRLAS